jgi:cell division protein FtsN
MEGLREAVQGKKRHNKQAYTLDMGLEPEGPRGGQFWSPQKIQDARDREVTKQQEKQQQEAQKKDMKELREANKLYKIRIAEEKRVETERKKVEQQKKKADEAAEKARKAAEKKAEQEAATLQKVSQQANKPKRKFSHKAQPKTVKKRRVGGGPKAAVVPEPAPPPPPKASTRGRNIKLPAKYR